MHISNNLWSVQGLYFVFRFCNVELYHIFLIIFFAVYVFYFFGFSICTLKGIFTGISVIRERVIAYYYCQYMYTRVFIFYLVSFTYLLSYVNWYMCSISLASSAMEFNIIPRYLNVIIVHCNKFFVCIPKNKYSNTQYKIINY